jgi:hypothetical protein
MPWVGFESTIPASERAKTVHALDRSATVTGSCLYCCFVFGRRRFQGSVRRTVTMIVGFHSFHQPVQANAGERTMNASVHIQYFTFHISFYHSTSQNLGYEVLKKSHMNRNSINPHVRCWRHQKWKLDHWWFLWIECHITFPIILEVFGRIGNIKPSAECLSGVSNMGAARKWLSAAPCLCVFSLPACRPVARLFSSYFINWKRREDVIGACNR